MASMAVLNGHTYAGGCFFALAHDFRTMISSKANPKSKFCVSEAKIGLPVPVPVQKLMETAVTPDAGRILRIATPLKADECLKLGVVDYLYDDTAEVEA